MKILTRYGLLILAIMSILLPLWLTLGRLFLFEAGGLVTAFAVLFIYVPAIFAICWVFFIMLILRREVRTTLQIGAIDATLLCLFYIGIFLAGVFLVDASTTPGSANSVAMNFGMNQTLSNQLYSFFTKFSLVIAAFSFLVFLSELIAQETLHIKKPKDTYLE